MKRIITLLTLLLLFQIESNAQNCGPSDDIVQNSITGTGGFGTGALQGQTFEATCTGPIEDITVFVANANNNVVPATLELYQGQFTGSQTPIATTTEVINSTSTTVAERFDFTTPVDLVAGQTYSFVIYNTAGIVSFEGSNTNPYPDGVRLFIAGSQVFPAPTTDLRFRVGYEDNDPPNAVCMNTTLSLGPDGTVVITPNDIDGGSNGGIATSFVFPNILTCDDLGENEVELSVGDISGNFASCDAIVTIVDDLPPAFTGCQDITVNTDIGQCTAVVNYADIIQISDNCGIDIIDIVGPASGSVFPIGTTQISYEATDVNGNISSCSFNIIVEDNEGPIINCPTDVTINCASLGVTETITGTNTTAITIPDNNDAGISSMIAISGVSSASNVLDMSVEMSIDHTWVGDLTIELEAPTGETLSLVSVTLNDSSDLDQNFPITFTDTATTSANNLGSGLAGPGVICEDNNICEYYPSAGSDAFAQFINTLSTNDSNLNGDWKLNIEDSADGDEGSLEEWNITINTFDPDAVTANVIDTDPSATGMATAADSCGGDVVITFSDTVVDGCGISETITRTWTATDEIGNISTCDQIISIVDTIAPTLTSCPEDVVILLPDGATGAIATYALPTAQDVCGDVTITQTEGLASGVEFPAGITTNTFSITDPCGNEIICSFTVTITAMETQVDLSGGALTVTDINGGISDDDLTLSNDGTILTISNLVPPVAVSGSVVLATDTSVTVTLADITNGIVINGVGGIDDIEITEALSLIGATNSFSASNVNNFVQSAALTIGSDLLLTGNGTSTINLGEMNAGSITVTEFNTINDTAGQIITISGTAHFAANNTIDIEEGQNNHTFGGEVSLQATNSIFFTAGSTTTFGEISAAGDGFINDITVLPGDIIFNDNVTISGGGSNLFVCGVADITQTSGIVEVPFLILRGNGNTTASLDNDNNIQALATSNPFDANAVDLASLSFTNNTNMFLEIIHVNEFDLTAPEFDLEPNFTVITKEGTGESNFNANIDLNNGTGTAIMNHNAGTINFNGDNTDLSGRFTYNGVDGTITNINSTDITLPFGGPGVSVTFGFLNVFGDIFVGDTNNAILNEARFSGVNAVLGGIGTLSGGPTFVENQATLQPGGETTPFSVSTANLEINGATFAPIINSNTSFDFVTVNGTVTLSDATFAPVVGFIAQPDDEEMILIINDDIDPVVGTFNNLPEGAGVTFGDYAGMISYVGGDGNDVVLVPDTLDPVAVCQDITLTIGVDGLTVTGDQLDGGSTDNAAISNFLIDGVTSIDYTLDDLGDNEVTITVIDSSGNTAECTATITLVSNVNVTLPIVISEFQPLPTESNNGPNQNIEIKGASGESFVGTFVIIDGDQSRSGRGLVVNATDISGTFNTEGILTASVPNFTNPTHTAVLTSAFNGTVDITDIDTDNDGTVDDLAAFGTIFDAVGVKDGGVCCPVNVTYGGDFGGIDLPNIGSPPAAIFRDASTGDFYQLNTSGTIYDNTNTVVDASIFDSTPTVDGTFGTINPSTTSQVIVSPTIYLQGAFTNPNAGEETLMRDDLRVNDLIPTTSPYGDGATVNPTVLSITGVNAVVDWIWVELRDATDNTIVIDGTSALVLRNGSVVDTDGTSALTFEQDEDAYHVAVNHRNHLGVITANTVALSSTTTSLDFTSDIAIANGETLALTNMGNGIFAIYAGDTTGDGNILNTDISNAISNSGGINVYTGADANMDGNILNTDIALIIQPNAGRIQQF